MKNTEANSPVDLSTMLGSSSEIEVNGKTYEVMPILLKDIEKFMDDNLSIGSQIYNLTSKEARNKTNFWLTKYCFDENGEPVTLEKAIKLEWNIVDLKKYFKKLCDVSG